MRRLIIAALILSTTGAPADPAAPPVPNPPVGAAPPIAPAQVDPSRTIILTGPLSTIRRVEQSIQRSPYLSGREATEAVELIETELARQAQPPAPPASPAPAAKPK